MWAPAGAARWLIGRSPSLKLVNLEFRPYQLEFRRADEAGMSDGDPEEPALELCCPKIKERLEFWKARRQIVFLPDVALQKRGVVGEAV